MATEQSEPRIGLITVMSVVSIVIFVLLRYFLQSYYHIMYSEEYAVKFAENPSPLVGELRDQQRAQLGGIEAAMRNMASGTRPAALSPMPSTDADPLKGWAKLPRPYVEPPPPAPAPVLPVAPPVPVSVGDGGVMPQVADAAVVPTNADAAAPAPIAPAEGASSGTSTGTTGAQGVNAPAAQHPAH